MHYTYNTTFVMSPNVGADFMTWLQGEASGAFTAAGAMGARLQKVVGIGGEAPGPEHGLSVALQTDFQAREEADKWGEERLPGLLGGFMAKFGPSAAYFTTLLETSALK